MFSCLSSCAPLLSKNPIPFRVRDVEGNRRYGIATTSVADLQRKVRKKFGVSGKGKFCLVLEEDGTEIDDDEYLFTLTYNTVLVFVDEGQEWAGAASLLESALAGLFRATHLPRAAEQIKELMQDEGSSWRCDVLGKLATSLDMNVEAEARAEDKQWFSDVPPKYKTKTDFMRDKARVRVRGYLYHTKDFISKQTLKGRSKRKMEYAVDDFLLRLKEKDYFSDYFARTTLKTPLRLCDAAGWFGCEGAFNVKTCCHADHRINPYGSRDGRILFSTWDLDHGVEKSREVLPRLKEAAAHRTKEVNLTYFFELLFTRNNLKLVHPVCHDKTGHLSAKCDPSKIYL